MSTQESSQPLRHQLGEKLKRAGHVAPEQELAEKFRQAGLMTAELPMGGRQKPDKPRDKRNGKGPPRVQKGRSTMDQQEQHQQQHVARTNDNGVATQERGSTDKVKFSEVVIETAKDVGTFTVVAVAGAALVRIGWALGSGVLGWFKSETALTEDEAMLDSQHR